MPVTDDYGELVSMTPAGLNELNELILRIRAIEKDNGYRTDKLSRLEVEVASVRGELEANTEVTQSMSDNLADLVDFFTAMKGMFKVLNWAGKVAKPLAAIVGLVAAIFTAYSAWKSTR